MITIERQPIKAGGHVIIDSCTASGHLKRQICAKSVDKVLYRSARKARWGDIYDTDRFIFISFLFLHYRLAKANQRKREKEKRPWKEIRARSKSHSRVQQPLNPSSE